MLPCGLSLTKECISFTIFLYNHKATARIHCHLNVAARSGMAPLFKKPSKGLKTEDVSWTAIEIIK
jgi:hypothetical protein